jgi:lipoic acid synthetase
MGTMNKVLPAWLKQRLPKPSEVDWMNSLLANLGLNTVCQSASCPNLGECFSERTATFMIMGRICTRNCRFCAIEKGHAASVMLDEPQRISEAVRRLGLDYVVVTSVTRDDLPDGGVANFVKTLEEIHSNNLQVKIEVLIPDFQGSSEALGTLMQASLDVVGHNIETVPRLYHSIRPGADYLRSLRVLNSVKSMRADLLTKSGIMLGLGENSEEVIHVMRDLREVGCDILTIGQYLSPSSGHVRVERYVSLGEFDNYALIAHKVGFKAVVSGSLVRSSYRASMMYQDAISNK